MLDLKRISQYNENFVFDNLVKYGLFRWLLDIEKKYTPALCIFALNDSDELDSITKHLETKMTAIADEMGVHAKAIENYSIQMLVSIAAIITACFTLLNNPLVLTIAILIIPAICIYFNSLIISTNKKILEQIIYLRKIIEPKLAYLIQLPIDTQWYIYCKKCQNNVERSTIGTVSLLVMWILWFTAPLFLVLIDFKGNTIDDAIIFILLKISTINLDLKTSLLLIVMLSYLIANLRLSGQYFGNRYIRNRGGYDPESKNPNDSSGGGVPPGPSDDPGSTQVRDYPRIITREDGSQILEIPLQNNDRVWWDKENNIAALRYMNQPKKNLEHDLHHVRKKG